MGKCMSLSRLCSSSSRKHWGLSPIPKKEAVSFQMMSPARVCLTARAGTAAGVLLGDRDHPPGLALLHEQYLPADSKQCGHIQGRGKWVYSREHVNQLILILLLIYYYGIYHYC